MTVVTMPIIDTFLIIIITHVKHTVMTWKIPVGSFSLVHRPGLA